MMSLQHAPKGGECNSLLGRFYKGGEFEPFYIPREVMPQIDGDDMPELLDFLKDKGEEVRECTIDPWLVRAHQRVDARKAKALVGSGVLSKPCLLSKEPYILDGNHRWLGHVIAGSRMPAIKLVNKTFLEGVELLLSFPKAYQYGDGNFHPVRN